MTVFEQIDQRLESLFSMNKYMPFPEKWNRIIQGLPKLTAQGSHAIQLAGRFDVVSQELYGDPMLDWILMVYNGITRIGNSSGKEVKNTILLTLEAGESITFDIALEHSKLQVLGGYVLVNEMWNDSNTKLVPVYEDLQGRSYCDASEDGDNDVLITYNPVTGQSIVENTDDDTVRFQIIYTSTLFDDYLDTGTEILYPSIKDVEDLLTEAEVEEDAGLLGGFARL